MSLLPPYFASCVLPNSHEPAKIRLLRLTAGSQPSVPPLQAATSPTEPLSRHIDLSSASRRLRKRRRRHTRTVLHHPRSSQGTAHIKEAVRRTWRAAEGPREFKGSRGNLLPGSIAQAPSVGLLHIRLSTASRSSGRQNESGCSSWLRGHTELLHLPLSTPNSCSAFSCSLSREGKISLSLPPKPGVRERKW